MTSDLRVLAGLDRVIHEASGLMIMTVLYANAEADLCTCRKYGSSKRGSFESSGKIGSSGLRAAREEFKGKYAFDGLQPHKEGPGGARRICTEVEGRLAGGGRFERRQSTDAINPF